MAKSTEGFDDLFDTLNALGNLGKRVGKNAVKVGAEEVLKQQKLDAPKDSEQGSESLDMTNAKTYKSGDTYIGVGITKENWEECKGLWFQHWGYELYKNGEIIDTNVGWMDESFAKCKDKAQQKMINEVSKEIDKIIK